jgi:hypothetical protein
MEKTKLMFRKQRRNFSALATFVSYEGGNAHVKLLKPITLLKPSIGNPEGLISDIVIPIFFTKIIATSVNDIPEAYSRI